ncbi:MAG: hypothetical protein ABSA66_14100 [Roseiarcus sp.]|jgi:hypothetical protein
MTPEEYATMPTERLLRLFAETARQSGAGRVFQYAGGSAPADLVVPTTAETKAGFTENAAIAGALRVNATKREIEPLFDSDDPDVRLCAAMFFSDFAPDLAQAAQHGVMANVSTREALALGRRARQPPPPRPTLQEMTDEALVARFQDAAERQTACRFTEWLHDPKDLETRNAVVGELTAILREMKRRGMLARLLPFLDSADVTARFRAAQGCLRIAPDKAVPVLEGVAATAEMQTRIAADTTLENWRKGVCLVDKL